jgi:serine/threonine protein kinase
MDNTYLHDCIELLSLSINNSNAEISASVFLDIWKQAIGAKISPNVDRLATDNEELLSKVEDLLEQKKLYSNVKDRNASKGGFAEVRFIRHNELERTFALKEVVDEELFNKEVKILAKLDHPNIVKLYDTSRMNRNGIVTYVLKLEALGMSLSEFVSHQAVITVRELVNIMLDALHALSYMHSKNVVHCDIKPENIHVQDEMGNPFTKIIDFGCSAKIGDVINHHSEVYSCPELRKFERPLAAPHVDTYSVGATLQRCFTVLQLPLPQGLRAVINKATSEKPSERYLTALEMITALETKYIQQEFARPTWMPTTYVIDKCYQGYKRENIHAQWLRDTVDNSADLLSHEHGNYFFNAYQTKVPIVNKLLQEKKIWENNIISMKDVTISRTSGEEVPVLNIKYGRSLYSHFKKVYMALAEAPHHMRNKIASQMQDNFQFSSCFSTSMGVQVTLITSDRKVLFCRRTFRVAVASKIYTGSATETMDMRDVDKNGLPDPWLTCMRLLDEELGIKLDKKDIDAIKITGLHCRRDMMSGFLAYIDMANTSYVRKTSKEIMEHFELGIGQDTRLESDLWVFVDLEPKTLFDFMAKHDISSNGVIFAMRALLGEEQVNSELFKRYTVKGGNEILPEQPQEQPKVGNTLTVNTEYKHSERRLSPGAVLGRINSSPI